MDEDSRIASLDEIPTDSTLLFTVREGFDKVEVICIELADGVAAWRNYCQHWTDVRLDKGSGAYVRNGEIVCEKHGAYFEGDTGRCTLGPCEGAFLNEVEVAVEDGVVYLTDDRYEFEHLGPSGAYDLSSGGRIDFTGN
ncbi:MULTISPECIES: Rieske 2Fe-2S domain-containing protein [unclassified Haladaptatus]|uniref:Rieske (2Fe-2S) protein n=1 Tax=unclassified Haladaptatus TaxID=2622732 RepID=UPI0023E87C2B|nr:MULTISPECIES: Rieske 2Fe-2S domain-containing protein [unclassified Haladaptatus]